MTAGDARKAWAGDASEPEAPRDLRAAQRDGSALKAQVGASVLDALRGFGAEMDGAMEARFRALACAVRADALSMISRAGSGHPGGALSSADMILMALLVRTGEDAVLVSHGHVSAALYAALGHLGYYPVEEAVEGFRKPGSPFEGHPSRLVRGVEWTSGALGQGLSVGCGMALARRIRGERGRVYVLMGDGEQQKGQIAEARAFAAKYRLDVVAVIDMNGLQSSGPLDEVMPTPIAALYRANGFRVVEADGHDPRALYRALSTPGPAAVLCATHMGQGSEEITDDWRYHGQPLSAKQLYRALSALYAEEQSACAGFEPSCAKDAPADVRAIAPTDVPECAAKDAPDNAQAVAPSDTLADAEDAQERASSAALGFGAASAAPEFYTASAAPESTSASVAPLIPCTRVAPPLDPGVSRTYPAGTWVEVRRAAGEALCDVLAANPSTPCAVLDCDLLGALRLNALERDMPERLIRCGIAEANAVSIAGGLAASGVHAFAAGFANFMLGEAVSQHRMNSLNHAPVKLLLTHSGLDVGEDGKTHQCVDAVALLSAMWDMKLAIPADANQADRMVRWMAAEPGSACVLTGRSALPVLAAPPVQIEDAPGMAPGGDVPALATDGDAVPAFTRTYRYGHSDWLRAGGDVTLVAAGPMIFRALDAAALLAERGLSAGVLAVSSPFDMGPELYEAAPRVAVMEDHKLPLGLSALCALALGRSGSPFHMLPLGVTHPGLSGPPDALYEREGLSAHAVADRVERWMREPTDR